LDDEKEICPKAERSRRCDEKFAVAIALLGQFGVLTDWDVTFTFFMANSLID
jgi:hypothetical protein